MTRLLVMGGARSRKRRQQLRVLSADGMWCCAVLWRGVRRSWAGLPSPSCATTSWWRCQTCSSSTRPWWTHTCRAWQAASGGAASFLVSCHQTESPPPSPPPCLHKYPTAVNTASFVSFGTQQTTAALLWADAADCCLQRAKEYVAAAACFRLTLLTVDVCCRHAPQGPSRAGSPTGPGAAGQPADEGLRQVEGPALPQVNELLLCCVNQHASQKGSQDAAAKGMGCLQGTV